VLRVRRYREGKIEAFRHAIGDKDPKVFPNFRLLADVLANFFPELCADKAMNPDNASASAIENFKLKDLIVNSAVLMLAKRPMYSLRLINELEHISKAIENDLNQTALSAIFGNSETTSDEQSLIAISAYNLSYAQQKAANVI
jgi:hypothetical protein